MQSIQSVQQSPVDSAMARLDSDNPLQNTKVTRIQCYEVKKQDRNRLMPRVKFGDT